MRNLFTTLTLSLLSICFCTGAYSRQNLNFYHIGTETGLSQMQINGLYQDEFGLLWIGTRDGVKYYDGNKVIPLHINDYNNWTLSNFVPTICGDGNGHLYINTNFKIMEYDLQNGSIKDIFFQENTSVAPTIVFSYGFGKLWIGTQNEIYHYKSAGGG